jgi:hypothetical protein
MPIEELEKLKLKEGMFNKEIFRHLHERIIQCVKINYFN